MLKFYLKVTLLLSSIEIVAAKYVVFTPVKMQLTMNKLVVIVPMLTKCNLILSEH